jgi:hypothetical protein
MHTHCHLGRCWWSLSWLTARNCAFARHVEPQRQRPLRYSILLPPKVLLEGNMLQTHIYATPLYSSIQLIIRSLIMYATNSSHESRSTSTNCSSWPSKVACMKHGDVAFSNPNLLFMYSSAFCRYIKLRKKLEQSGECCVPCRSWLTFFASQWP